MHVQHFSCDQLNDAKRFYGDNGFVVVEDVFSDHQIRLARQVWGTVLEKKPPSGDRRYRPLLLPHVHYPAILSFIETPSFLGSVRALLGNDVQHLQTQLKFGFPRSQGFTSHQDNFTNRVRPPDAALAAWIAMEGVTAENGALKVWPGSHTHGLYKVKFDWLYLLKRSPDLLRAYFKVILPGYFGAANDCGVMERYSSCTTTEVFEEVVVEVASGGVVFMHGDLVHASLPNSSPTRFRYSLLTNFIRHGSGYCSGILTGRKPVDLA